MRLVPVPEPPYFHARCTTCAQSITSGEKIADLDAPRGTYYHDHPSCLPKGHEGQRIERTPEDQARFSADMARIASKKG